MRVFQNVLSISSFSDSNLLIEIILTVLRSYHFIKFYLIFEVIILHYYRWFKLMYFNTASFSSFCFFVFCLFVFVFFFFFPFFFDLIFLVSFFAVFLYFFYFNSTLLSATHVTILTRIKSMGWCASPLYKPWLLIFTMYKTFHSMNTAMFLPIVLTIFVLAIWIIFTMSLGYRHFRGHLDLP